MKNLLVFLLIIFPIYLFGQWVDTIYSIETLYDIEYNTAFDFAGNERNLSLDISYPINDEAPMCGRPLLVMIHGGGFIDGDKNEGYSKRIRQDFAKRGYTTASIQYRLGQFQTNQEIHCNISNFGLPWDCLNMADTSEWYRAYIRGIQDVNGAIRYLVNNADTYDIDPNNIFVVGESAGAFIAMGVGFIDTDAEVLSSLTVEMPNVLPPNPIYEVPCVQFYNFDTSIVAMNLARPDLGNYQGESNFPLNTTYTIKGVGNFYGAAFNNIFHTSNNAPPSLYLFHQPNDLIVPYHWRLIFAGYAYCATQFPANCVYIQKRPYVFGSHAIKNTLDSMASNGITIPDYLFETTNNNASCLEQLANESLSAHAMDNYFLRTNNMATFFAEKIEACPNAVSEFDKSTYDVTVYPNPNLSKSEIILEGEFKVGDLILLRDVKGHLLFSKKITVSNMHQININIEKNNIAKGVYFIQIIKANDFETHKVLIL